MAGSNLPNLTRTSHARKRPYRLPKDSLATRGVCVLFGLIAANAPLHAAAQDIELSGELALEVRTFPDTARFESQFNGTQFSGSISPEVFWESQDRDHQVKIVPFARIDSQDDERSHIDVREAYYRRISGNWEVLVGMNRVFWGVTESRHLVNVVNQLDAVEDIDEEDFLGQPMVQVTRQTNVGRFSLLYLPVSRERTFPGLDGRLRTPIPIDGDAAIYESRDKEWHPSFAARYSHYVGAIDIGLSAYHGTAREPNILPSPDGTSVTPLYPIITQAGLDLQFTKDAWLWKFEGIIREGQGRTFAAAVGGVEYTFFQIFESNADLGLIAEGLYDGRDSDISLAAFANGTLPPAQGFIFPTTLEQDVFLGARLALNDVQNTSLLAGLVTDIENGPSAFRIEAERRIGDSFTIGLDAQVFIENAPNDPAALFGRDTFLNLRLSKFF